MRGLARKSLDDVRELLALLRDTLEQVPAQVRALVVVQLAGGAPAARATAALVLLYRVCQGG